MDTDSLSAGQFGGMTSTMGGGSSSSDMTGLSGPLGSSGTPSPMGAGSASFPALTNGGA
jgi:hypothetical protein